MASIIDIMGELFQILYTDRLTDAPQCKLRVAEDEPGNDSLSSADLQNPTL
jgi:hypothetical protein